LPQQDARFRVAQAGETSGSAGHGAGPSESHAAAAGHGESHGHKLGEIPAPWLLFSNACLVAILLVAFGVAATRRMAAIPKGFQNLGEFIAEVMVNFTRGIIGPGGEKYVPLVGTIFFFIYVGNMIGLVPGFHSPTANLSTTLALGLIVFLYVQFLGIRARGLGGYLKHFMGPMPAVAWLLFPVEVISEIVKPFTLAMRLFGNIFGEDTVIVVLASLAIMVLPTAPVLPLHFPIMVLGLLTCFVQAMVFSLLTCIYIALQTHHDDDHGHAEHGHEPAHAH
jgi:F-type H+-transporting ATPase subunit a